MAYTYTSTKTTVSRIGDGLVEKYPDLKDAAEQMKVFAEKYREAIERVGFSVRVEPSDNESKLDLMIYQWQKIMPLSLAENTEEVKAIRDLTLERLRKILGLS